ncbi:MAG: hypothetical protein Q4C01_05430 [Clostridia bacterium]|nr:hypothetical protein [Clostridia bacterium]
MLIAIFGESCVGKSTLSERLKARLGFEVYTGKDYKRLARSEGEAQKLFCQRLLDSVDGDGLIWVISEREDMPLLPEGAVRVLMTADLETIKARFAERMHGQLPPPVAMMLERKHGSFDSEPHMFFAKAGETDMDLLVEEICACTKQQEKSRNT